MGLSRAGHGRAAGLLVVPGHGARRVRRACRAGRAGREPRQDAALTAQTAPRAPRTVPRRGHCACAGPRSGHLVPRRSARARRAAGTTCHARPRRRQAQGCVPRAPWPRAAPVEHATPARSEHAGRAPTMAGECRAGRREKRGGEEGGGEEVRVHHGNGDSAGGFEGRGGSVRLRAMWRREGALGDMGVRHEERLGKTALPSGPHGRRRRRLGRFRARVWGEVGRARAGSGRWQPRCGPGWAGGEERRMGHAGEAGRKEGRWPSGPRRAALGRPTRTEGRRPNW
jgi:hypothetical protein